MTGTPLVSIEQRDGICIVTLDRPGKLNALSTDMQRDLLRAVRSDTAASSRCVVLRGAGRSFCSGADAAELAFADPESAMRHYDEDGGEVYEALAGLRQPTIAAVHGWCLGGGFELALACDFRVVARSAKFGLPEIHFGIVPSAGAMYRLSTTVGLHRAKELVLLRQHIDAIAAMEIGLVTELVGDEELLDKTMEHARSLSALPPLAARLGKAALNLMPASSREAGIAIERLTGMLLAQTRDARDAAGDFAPRSNDA